ncbi:hypothetical protein [Sporolactobacillus terrae]|uniref:Uncharacterized protein n=1 Tax=Sporolactobacillus terrae TaxID=269673 RepID=A0A5K7X8K2_9BACL|nr:hypothetical protein [Sporolactobacillus terrae]BBO00027.1 hypothetical protein St703_27310 [Sporolactobacillus terrae]
MYRKIKPVLIFPVLAFVLLLANPVSAEEKQNNADDSLSVNNMGPEYSDSTVWEEFLKWWKKHHD